MTEEVKKVIFGCVDGPACPSGSKIEVDVTLPGPPGWTYMEMRKGYRCPACVKALAKINSMHTNSDADGR